MYLLHLTLGSMILNRIHCECRSSVHLASTRPLAPAQVVFGGDPESALIQYTANEEARRAISSTEAVLNNRFIRVYWHREATDYPLSAGPGGGAGGGIGGGIGGAVGALQQEQSSGPQGSAPAHQHSNMHKVGTGTLSPFCRHITLRR